MCVLCLYCVCVVCALCLCYVCCVLRVGSCPSSMCVAFVLFCVVLVLCVVHVL